MTAFETKCINTCQRFIRDTLKLTNVNFMETVGKHETYYTYALEKMGHKFEVYVYSDEAGFMVDGHDWSICERPDYTSDEELINSFIEKLRKAIFSFQPSNETV